MKDMKRLNLSTELTNANAKTWEKTIF